MKNLLYKEFRLSINPMFYLVLLFSTLLLIPQWVFLLAPMYFLFIAAPNVFTTGKAQNDLGFSAMLPVRRRDIVKARVLSMAIFEILQVLATAVFAAIHLAVYPVKNFFMDTNATYIGCVFMMFAVYNIVFFPMFYKSADRIGVPVIAGVAAALLFSTGAELLLIFVPALNPLGGRGALTAQFAVLAGGIIIFTLLTIAAYRISAKRFESVNL